MKRCFESESGIYFITLKETFYGRKIEYKFKKKDISRCFLKKAHFRVIETSRISSKAHFLFMKRTFKIFYLVSKRALFIYKRQVYAYELNL